LNNDGAIRERPRRLLPAIELAFAVLLFVFSFYEGIRLIVESWFTYQASHGFLILAVSGVMVWKKLPELRAAEIRPDILWGGLLTLFACLVLLTGKLSLTAAVEKNAVIAGLLGLVFLLGGRDYFKILFIPICYLVFGISTFDVLLSGQAVYFQLASASIASHILDLFGIPVFRSGQVITLPHITLDVATACSGINHILALCGLAVPLAMVTQKARWGVALLVVEAFFVGILANGIRVAAIGVWTYLINSASVHGPMDVFLVSSTFGLGFVLLLMLSALQGRISWKSLGVSPKEIKPEKQRIATGRLHWAVAAAGFLFLVTGSYMSLYQVKPVRLDLPFEGVPWVMGDWAARGPYQGSVKMDNIVPDDELLRTYSNSGGNRIHVYAGYFANQTGEKKIFMSAYGSLMAKGTKRESANLNPSLTLGYTRNERSSVFFGYIIDGKIIPDTFMAKLAMMKNALFYRRNNAGVLIIETDPVLSLQGANRSKEENFITELVPFILADFENGQGNSAFSLPAS
jgi:exosortase